MLRPNWNDDQARPEQVYSDRRYEVIVGFTRVEVSGGSRQEAIEQARHCLSREMPRMWDIIHSLGLERFDVRELNPE